MTRAFLIQQGLLGILLPIIIASLVYFASKSFLKERAIPIAIIIAFLAGYFGLSGFKILSLSPKTVQQWMPWASLIALALLWLEPILKNSFLRWGFRFILFELFLYQVFQPFINHPFASKRWSLATTAQNMLITTLVVFIFFFLIDYLCSKDNDNSYNTATMLGFITIIAIGSSLSLVQSESLVMGQLTAIVAAVLGVLSFINFILPNDFKLNNLSPVIVILLVLPWLAIYKTLSIFSILILVLSPLILLIKFKENFNLKITSIKATTLLALMGLAILLA